jgi:hypothetical protein
MAILEKRGDVVRREEYWEISRNVRVWVGVEGNPWIMS